MKLVKDNKFLQANLLLIVSLIIFFYRPIFTDRIQVPSDALQTYPFFRVKGLSNNPQNPVMFDVFAGLIPGLHFNMTSLKQGHLPLWNPYIGCGAPNIANMLPAFFYPLTFFVYLFGLKWGLFFLYFFKLYFVGIFMYLYTRKLGIKHEISVISSCALMYAGYNTFFLYWPLTNLAFYLPLGLLATELILDTPDRLKGYLLLSIGSVIAVFGGHPESLFQESLILGFYFIVRLFQNRKQGYTNKILIKMTLFIFAAILISAIQWLPFLQYLHFSYSYLQRSSVYNSHYLPPFVLFISIIPDFCRSFLKTDIVNAFNNNSFQLLGYFGYLGIEAYVGITIFLFFLKGLISFYKNTFILLFIIILSYIGILTFNVPILRNLIIHLPLFRVTDTGTFMLGCSNIFVILIAAIAMNEFFKDKMHFNSTKYSLLILISIIIILLVVYISSINKNVDPLILKKLYSSTARDIIITLLFLLATVLILRMRNVNLQFYLLLILVFSQTALPFIGYETAIKPAYLYPQNNIIKTLKQQQPPFRVLPLSLNSSLELNLHGLFTAGTNADAEQLSWNPSYEPAWPVDINIYYEIEDIRHFDGLDVQWYEFLSRTMSLPDFLNLANVKYIVLNQDDLLTSMSLNLEPIVKDNGFILYKNLSAFDRAFMVYDYRVADNDNEFLKLTVNNSAKLHNLAVIVNRDIKYASFKTNRSGTNNHNKITFLSYHPSYIKMKVNTSSPGFLVISNTYFPGWKAYVDNKKSEIIRTDFAFDGLFLEKGDHTVVLTYKPLSFLIGLVLTIAGLISLLLASIFFSN